jgi:hypothetical protein
MLLRKQRHSGCWHLLRLQQQQQLEGQVQRDQHSRVLMWVLLLGMLAAQGR